MSGPMTAFAGTGVLIRLILRRDRIALPLWIVLLALLPVGFGSSYAQLYPTVALRQAFADEVAGNAAEIAMLGRVLSPTLGGMIAWRWTMAGTILLGGAALLTVIRHTRTEEEAGRRELVGATAAGRFAPLTATLTVACVGCLLSGLLATVTLLGTGLPAAGSVALGLSAVAAGCLFAAAAAVAAQIAQRAGAARGLVAILLGVCYLLRIVGDSATSSGLGWLTWLSPMGWMRAVRPFAGEQWWVFALFVVAIALLLTAAYTLAARRDLGAGLLPAHSGPAVAAPGLRTPLALGWRLQRGALWGWTAGFAVLGAVFGYVAQTAASQMPTGGALVSMSVSPAQMGDGFFTLALLIFVEVVAVYAIQAALRLRSEEIELRAEPVLAAAVSRVQWAAGHIIWAALGPAAVLGAFGLAAGLTYGVAAGNVAYELPRVLGAALAYVPAVWVLTGIALALFGLAPRLTALSWAALAVCAVLDMAAELRQISASVASISPFADVPKVLLGQGSILWLVALVIIAAALAAAGLAGLQRREIGPT
jgi:ABC-2 type transport system permease protein